MYIHEFQAKALLAQYAIPVPEGCLAADADEAIAAARTLDTDCWVVKAQIHAGGRGQAGGVRLVDSIEKVGKATERLLEERLITTQTGPEGMRVERVLVEGACEIEKELYLGVLVDRANAQVTFLASPEGGMTIEAAVGTSTGQVAQIPIDIRHNLERIDVTPVVSALGLSGALGSQAESIARGLAKAFVELDATLIEINPLVVSGQRLVAIDAKMTLDDNALARHEDLQSLREEDVTDPDRLERERHGYNYIRLDGDIATVVTGAGLALATIDLIELHGGRPANFLDLPPAATRVQIAAATRQALRNPKARVLLINAVGGGITRCDVIAEGIATAAREMEVQVPVIVRFDGTSKEMGVMLLENSRLGATLVDDFSAAVRLAVQTAAGGTV